jgi:two-component system response regulator
MGTPIEVLLVEDDLGDVQLAREALGESDLDSRLHVALGGEEARSFLQRVGSYATAPRPHLVLLSLNLPDNDGYDLLAEVQADKNLRRIPVVVVTTSKPQEDILQTDTDYIIKPMDRDQFMAVIERLKDSGWMQEATTGKPV